MLTTTNAGALVAGAPAQPTEGDMAETAKKITKATACRNFAVNGKHVDANTTLSVPEHLTQEQMDQLLSMGRVEPAVEKAKK